MPQTARRRRYDSRFVAISPHWLSPRFCSIRWRRRGKVVLIVEAIEEVTRGNSGSSLLGSRILRKLSPCRQCRDSSSHRRQTVSSVRSELVFDEEVLDGDVTASRLARKC